MDLQNSSLGISASIRMSGTQKRSLGPYSEKFFLIRILEI